MQREKRYFLKRIFICRLRQKTQFIRSLYHVHIIRSYINSFVPYNVLICTPYILSWLWLHMCPCNDDNIFPIMFILKINYYYFTVKLYLYKKRHLFRCLRLSFPRILSERRDYNSNNFLNLKKYCCNVFQYFLAIAKIWFAKQLH